MKHLLDSLERRTIEFKNAPFFAFLGDTRIDPRKRLAFAPCAAYFVMTFSDLCTLVFREEPPKDKFQEFVNRHTREDEGHWQWFLADLETLGCNPQLAFSEALRFVWSNATVRMRLLSYHMCRLGLGADSVRKLVLVYSMEATFKATIERVARVAAEFAVLTGKKLIFLGEQHSETESRHTLDDPSVRDMILAIKLEPNRSTELLAVMDETFRLFEAFTDEMLEFAKNQAGNLVLQPAICADNPETV